MFYHDERVGGADDHGERVHEVVHLAREDEDGDAGDDPERRADGEEGLEAPAVPLDLLCCRQAVPKMGEQRKHWTLQCSTAC